MACGSYRVPRVHCYLVKRRFQIDAPTRLQFIDTTDHVDIFVPDLLCCDIGCVLLTVPRSPFGQTGVPSDHER